MEHGESRADRKERTRRAILDAALAIADTESLAGLSLRSVAKAAGIVPTGFYRHFASVDELGLALVEESFGSLRTMLREVRRDNPALRGVVEYSVLTLVDHVHRQRTHFRFIGRERFGGVSVVRTAISHELELFERELASDLARMPGLESWTGDDLRVFANLIVTIMVATAEALLDAPPDDPDAEQLIVQRAQRQVQMLVVGAAQWRSS